MNIWDAEGCGNTFRVVLVDDVSHGRAYAAQLRERGAWGFDSMLLLTPAQDASVEMRVLEGDGSESAMCGNGSRAVAAILDELGLPRTIRAGDQILRVDRIDDGVYRVRMGDVTFLGEVALESGSLAQTFLAFSAAGEPHHVVIVDDATTAPVEDWGSLTTPEANCTVVSVVAPGTLRALTYERGVNDVTQSCGTGACSAAQAVRRAQDLSQATFTVQMHDHELVVAMDGDLTFLQGPATFNSREEKS